MDKTRLQLIAEKVEHQWIWMEEDFNLQTHEMTVSCENWNKFTDLLYELLGEIEEKESEDERDY